MGGYTDIEAALKPVLNWFRSAVNGLVFFAANLGQLAFSICQQSCSFNYQDQHELVLGGFNIGKMHPGLIGIIYTYYGWFDIILQHLPYCLEGVF